MSREKWEEVVEETNRCFGSENVDRDEESGIIWAASRIEKLERVAEAANEVEHDAVVTCIPQYPAIRASVDSGKWKRMIDALRELEEK